MKRSVKKAFAVHAFLHKRGKNAVKNAVEIELTTRCNLGCYNCDRSTRQAPSDEGMSLKQVLFFMAESLRLKRNWEYVSVLGGEPALYPRLLSVLEYFRRFKFDTGKLQVVSNGYGSRVRAALKKLPAWVLVNDTRKTSPVQRFRFYNLAPADFGVRNAVPCRIPQNCGYGLTRYGYYPCGAGASIDRVFGFDVGIKRLEDLTPENTAGQLKILCRYCGHSPSLDKHLGSLDGCRARGLFRETYSGPALRGVAYVAPMSPSWVKAYGKYRGKKPVLRLYGETAGK